MDNQTTVTGQPRGIGTLLSTAFCAYVVEKCRRACRIVAGAIRQFFAFWGGGMSLSFSTGRSKIDTSSIKFTFDVEKTIAALAYMANGGTGARLDMFLSLKRLYLADRRALLAWGKTITGDTMISMDKGPLLSTVYDLFKGKGTSDNVKKWNAHFEKIGATLVRLENPANIGLLSEREKAALIDARDEINQVAPQDLPAILHQRYPEWEDPHGGSKTIDPATILRKVGRSEDEIRRIEEEAEGFNYDAKMFGLLAK